MDFRTQFQIHQLAHAFNTYLPWHHSKLNLGCEIGLHNHNPSLNRKIQEIVNYPIVWMIDKYHSPVQTLNLNLTWRGAILMQSYLFNMTRLGNEKKVVFSGGALVFRT